MKYNYEILLTLYNDKIPFIKRNNFNEEQYNIHEFIYIFIHEIFHYFNWKNGISHSLMEENLANRMAISFIKRFFSNEITNFLYSSNNTTIFKDENVTNFMQIYCKQCNDDIDILSRNQYLYDSFQFSSVKYAIESSETIDNIILKEYHVKINCKNKAMIKMSNDKYNVIVKKIMNKFDSLNLKTNSIRIKFNDFNITGCFKNEGRPI